MRWDEELQAADGVVRLRTNDTQLNAAVTVIPTCASGRETVLRRAGPLSLIVIYEVCVREFSPHPMYVFRPNIG